MYIALLLAISFSTFSLDDKINLGMTESELVEATSAVKVGSAGARSHSYTEFSEENPVVYIDRTSEKKKEYYFHDGKLYKVMTIYRNRVNDQSYYLEKINTLTKQFGEPSRKYTDQVVTLVVLHSVWENEQEELDLRFGAGYVYEVVTHKSMRKEKTKQDLHLNAI